MTQRRPKEFRKVLGWISDPVVSIEDFPAVVWWDGYVWWSGIPGRYTNLRDHHWKVTRWQALPAGADGEQAGDRSALPLASEQKEGA